MLYVGWMGWMDGWMGSYHRSGFLRAPSVLISQAHFGQQQLHLIEIRLA